MDIQDPSACCIIAIVTIRVLLCVKRNPEGSDLDRGRDDVT